MQNNIGIRTTSLRYDYKSDVVSDARITGNPIRLHGSFMIDHSLDLENKYFNLRLFEISGHNEGRTKRNNPEHFGISEKFRNVGGKSLQGRHLRDPGEHWIAERQKVVRPYRELLGAKRAKFNN